MTKLLILNDAQKATFDGLPQYDEDPDFPFDISGLTAEGKHVYRFAGPASGTVLEPVTLVEYIDGVGSDGDSASDTSKTFTLPSIPSGSRVAMFLVCTASGTNAGGTITPSAGSAFIGSQRGNQLDGEATSRSKIVLYSFTHAEWVAAGSPATITMNSSLACFMAAVFEVMVLVDDVIGTPVYWVGDDIPEATFGSAKSRLAFWAHTRTRHDAVMTTPPAGYSNVHRSRIGSVSSGSTAVDRTLFVCSKILTGAAEDVGAPVMGSPSGAARQAVLWVFE